MIKRVFLLGVLTFFAAAAPARAGETGEPPCALFTRADVVFYGKALKIESAPAGEDLPEGARKVRFQVLENFKGADNPTFTLFAADPKAGGPPFKSGQTFIVYAANDIVYKSFAAFRGVRVEPKTPGGELAALKEVAAGRSETAIGGRLAADAAGGYALAPAEIVVTGGGRTFAARTDAAGAFSVSVPAAGKYAVELRLPFAAKIVWPDRLLGVDYRPGAPTVFRYAVEVYAGDCNFSFFEVTAQ